MRMILNPSSHRNNPCDFDGDLRKMNVNEFKTKTRLCVFIKRNEFIFDVRGKRKASTSSNFTQRNKENKANFTRMTKEEQDPFSLCEDEEESYEEREESIKREKWRE